MLESLYMFKKLLLIAILFSNFLIASLANADEVSAYFVRPADAMTIGQGVQLHINKNYIAKLWHDKYAVVKSNSGKHNLMTKVGLSISVPVTGFGGAKKFKSKVVFDKDEHYFKIKFKPGLLAGQHQIIEIDKEEYLLLSSVSTEVKYK